jgi:hypothetical protein
MFGDIEYNYYFFYDAKGEKDMTFFLYLLVNYHILQ